MNVLQRFVGSKKRILLDVALVTILLTCMTGYYFFYLGMWCDECNGTGTVDYDIRSQEVQEFGFGPGEQQCPMCRGWKRIKPQPGEVSQ